MLEDDEMAGNEGRCPHCGERSLLVELVSVDVATRQWHRTRKLVHGECRDLYVADHLDAVLASLRMVAL